MLAVGAMLGGVVAGALGITVALIIDALTYVVSAILTLGIRGYEKPVASIEKTQTAHQPNQIVEGLRYARANPQVASSLLVKAGGAIGSTDTIMTIFATQIFATMNSGGEASLGILYGATGLGAVLGPILLNHFHDGTTERMQKAILWGFVLVTLGWAVISQASALWIVALGLGVRAMGGSANWTYSSAILQQTTDDAYLGRMFSLDSTLLHVMGIVGTIGTGALIDSLGAMQIHTVTWIIAALSLIPFLIWWMITQDDDQEESCPGEGILIHPVHFQSRWDLMVSYAFLTSLKRVSASSFSWSLTSG